MKNINGRNNFNYNLKEENNFVYNLTNISNNINQRRISNSEYNNNKGSFNNSNNIMKNFKKYNSIQTEKILKNFKGIIKQTESLKSRLMKEKINKNLNEYNNTSLKNKKILKNKIDDDNISIIHRKESDINYNTNDDFNFNISLNNSNLKVKENLKKNKSVINFYKNEFGKNKNEKIISLELINEDLMNSNKNLINQNNYLEKKIEKIKTDNIQEKPNQNNFYYKNLKIFINNLKLCSKNNINEKLKLSQKIFDITNKMKELYNKYNISIINYKKLNKIIKEDGQNLNGKNTKLNDLTKEQNILNKKLLNLKENLNNLKSKEKALSTKYESNIKSKQDFQELVYKLKKTIKYLKEGNSLINSSSNNSDLSLDLYESKISQLKSIIKYLENHKKLLKEENSRLKNDKNNLNINNNNEIQNKDIDKLKLELHDLKNENIQNKKDIEKEENQINILKENINNNDIQLNNLLNKNRIDEEIKKALNLNDMKLKEINYITKVYENIINMKDKEIFFLESKIDNKDGLLKTLKEKVKPLYKKNILHRGKSFTFSKGRDTHNKIF